MIASVLLSLVGACSAEPAPGTATATLAPAHANAMRDSVRGFLSAYGADMGAPPIGRNAREALAPFYAPDIVVSTDLSPDEPVVVATLDSLVPASEIVSQPAWIRSTRFEWGAMIVTPLAPGIATYTAKYTEHVIDTTGGTTSLPGVQHGVVRQGSDGWRFIAVQSSHPMATHQRQAALVARMTKAP